MADPMMRLQVAVIVGGTLLAVLIAVTIFAACTAYTGHPTDIQLPTI